MRNLKPRTYILYAKTAQYRAFLGKSILTQSVKKFPASLITPQLTAVASGGLARVSACPMASGPP
jgi:hypothetical protein